MTSLFEAAADSDQLADVRLSTKDLGMLLAGLNLLRRSITAAEEGLDDLAYLASLEEHVADQLRGLSTSLAVTIDDSNCILSERQLCPAQTKFSPEATTIPKTSHSSQ